MLDRYYKILNHKNLIEEKLPKIIEAFVNYYGEDKREYITQKFKNTTYITYLPIENLGTIIRFMKRIKTEEILNKIKNEISESISIDDLNILFDTNNYDSSLVHTYYKMMDDLKNGIDVNIPYSLKISDDKITLLDKIRPIIERYNEEYNSFLLTIKKQTDSLKKQDELTQILEKEVEIKFLKEFSNYIPKEEYEAIIDYYNKTGNVLKNLSKTFELMYGFNLHSSSLIEAFSDNNDKKLETGYQYEKETIINNRIMYFKSKGIDLGNDYNNYLTDEKCKTIVPSKDLIDKVKEYKEKAKRLVDLKIYEQYYDYVYNDNKFNKNSLLDEGGNLYSFYKSGTSCILPNIIDKEGKVIQKSTMLINMSNDYEDLDAFIIHEFNHLYEFTSIPSENKNEIIVGGGWDGWNVIYDPITGMYKEQANLIDGKRKYELLAEIVNDMIAQEIARGMHNNGVNIISDINVARFGSTGYQTTKMLVSDFINLYKNQIIESRSNNNMEAIYNMVGQANFDDLNNLFFEFNKYLGGMNFFVCLNELKEGKETELTIKLREIQEKRNVILENMKSYANKEHKSL